MMVHLMMTKMMIKSDKISGASARRAEGYMNKTPLLDI